MLELVEAADRGGVPEGVNLPAEIERREDRLAAIAEAKAKIEARAQEHFLREQAEYEAKRAKRQAREAAAEKKRGGNPSSRKRQRLAFSFPVFDNGAV
jgi:uncharacterized membrane-anchored protein